MQFLDKLNFQTKIILITFGMILLAVVSGAVAIDKVIVPAMEQEVHREARRVAGSVFELVRDLPDQNREAETRKLLQLIFRVRARLRYVELDYRDGRPPLWMGAEKYRADTAARFVNRTGEESLALKKFGEDDPIYEAVLKASGASPAGIAAVRAGVSAASIHRLADYLFRLLFTVTLGILVVGFFLIRLFTRMITRPVERLLEMMDSIAKGKMDFPGEEEPVEEGMSHADLIEVYGKSGRDELSRLVLAFRYMAATIRHFQEELKERYEFEERLLAACPDPIIANDRTGRIILFNKGAERLLGYSPEDIKAGLDVRDIYPHKDQPRKIKKALLSEHAGEPGVLQDYATKVVGKCGEPVPVRLSAAMIYEGTEKSAVVGYFHDLTELNAHVDAIVETNKCLNEANNQLARMNRRYMEMLSFVTHEMKSPISNAFMNANALRQEIFGPLTAEQSVRVEAICKNLDLSMEMIRHYLDLSRIEKDELPVQLQPTAILPDVIEPVLKGLAPVIAERSVTVERQVPANFTWTLDPELFRGVFTNLLSNALSYGEKNGTIRISVSDTGNWCRMEVWNSGAGIREQDRPKLFKKFQRLQPREKSSTRSTGLGLFITKTVVERHQGKIRVESEEGRWVSFIIELPSGLCERKAQ